MPIQLTFKDKAQYLLVEVSGGVWNAQDGADAIVSISDHAKKQGYKRILADRRNLGNPATEFARFEVGSKIAELFRPPCRFAVVFPHGKRVTFGEHVAVNRGATAKAFSDIVEAKQWLLEDLST